MTSLELGSENFERMRDIVKRIDNKPVVEELLGMIDDAEWHFRINFKDECLLVRTRV